MAAQIRENGKRFVRLSYGELTVGGLLTLSIGALTFAFSAGAQVNALQTALADKAGRFIVDSIGREVGKKADATRIALIEERLDELKYLTCLDHPEQATCRK